MREFLWSVIILVSAALGVAFAWYVNLEPKIFAMLPDGMPSWTSRAAEIACQTIVQLVLVAVGWWVLVYRVKRRARSLLRRLITPAQYAAYRRVGYIVEQIEGCTAFIHHNGTAWQPTRDHTRGVWECIYVANSSLCKEDKIIAQLLHARQGEFPRTHRYMLSEYMSMIELMELVP